MGALRESFDNFFSAPQWDGASEGKNNHQNLQDGFDQLWQIGDSTLASPSHGVSFDQVIEKQREEILNLKDELDFLKEDNLYLREELSKISHNFASFEKLRSDYASLAELNRCLTKQLNSIMRAQQRETFKLREIQKILSEA